MQEELQDHGSGLGQEFLESIDLLIPLCPHRLGDQLVDPNHQHILVVTAVEYNDLTPAWSLPVHPPEVVMVELLGCRFNESRHPGALGVEAPHDVANGAVFSGGVHT